jgi:aspartyl-tRNA(Asn)/glutamyl-tRNA(Gln) amidotransferase subunit C
MPEPRLSADEVRKVARLSRLAPSDSEIELYRGHLSAILGYVERLRGLDLGNVEPLTHISEETNRLDEDEPGRTLPTSALMGMAPDKLPPFVRVPKVIDDGGAA